MVTGLMDSITPSFVINSPEGIGRKHWTRYIWTICLPARSMAAGVYIFPRETGWRQGNWLREDCPLHPLALMKAVGRFGNHVAGFQLTHPGILTAGPKHTLVRENRCEGGSCR